MDATEPSASSADAFAKSDQQFVGHASPLGKPEREILPEQDAQKTNKSATTRSAV
jgi:hypothetical protein